jgi:hypothetical protein
VVLFNEGNGSGLASTDSATTLVTAPNEAAGPTHSTWSVWGSRTQRQGYAHLFNAGFLTPRHYRSAGVMPSQA